MVVSVQSGGEWYKVVGSGTRWWEVVQSAVEWCKLMCGCNTVVMRAGNIVVMCDVRW